VENASTWSASHRAWLRKIQFAERGAQATLLDYLGAVDALVIRRDALEATIGELVADSPWAQTVARLRCLRGIDTLSAVGLCAEVGNFERFERPGPLMSYLGWFPRRTQAARGAGRERSRSTAPGMPAGCWSRPPGTTAKHRGSGPHSSAAKKHNQPR